MMVKKKRKFKIPFSRITIKNERRNQQNPEIIYQKLSMPFSWYFKFAINNNAMVFA